MGNNWELQKHRVISYLKSKIKRQTPLELGAVLGAGAGLILVLLTLLLAGCTTVSNGVIAIPAEQALAADAIAQAQLPELVAHYQNLYEEDRGPSQEEYLLWKGRWESARKFYLEELLPGVSSATTFYRILKDIGFAVFGATL